MNALYFTSFIFCTMLVTYLSIRLSTPDRIRIQQEKERQERIDFADELINKIPEHESTI